MVVQCGKIKLGESNNVSKKISGEQYNNKGCFF